MSTNSKIEFDTLDIVKHLVHEANKENVDLYIEHCISEFFKGDLLFSLVEITLRKNVNKIGNIRIYCEHGEEGNYYSQYIDIIKKVQNKFYPNIVPNFAQWYNQLPYILINKGKKNNKVIDLLRWHPFPKEATRKSFIKDSLDGFKIDNYFDFYGDLMINEFGLKEYPHYCILIQPISLIINFKDRKTEKTIPIGNMYLHFASKNYHDEIFYKELLIKITYLWHKLYGASILYPTEVEINDKIKKNFYPLLRKWPRFTSTENLVNGKRIAIDQYYDLIFTGSKATKEFVSRLKDMYAKTLFFLNNDCFTNRLDEFNVFLQTLKKDASSIKELKDFPKDLKFFEKILFQREFFKIAYLLYWKSIEDIYLWFIPGERTSYNEKSMWAYFASDRFIQIQHRDNKFTPVKDTNSSMQSFFSSDFILDYRKLKKRDKNHGEIINTLSKDYPDIVKTLKNEKSERKGLIKSLCLYEQNWLKDVLKEVVDELDKEKYPNLEFCHMFLVEEIDFHHKKN